MKKILRILDTVVIGFMCVCTITFVCLIFAQVICRFVLNSSLTWSEELARYLFAELVFLGSGICVLEKKHASVDVIPNLLPASIRRYYLAVLDLLVIVSGVLLTIYGYRFALTAVGQTSPALRIPFQYVYAGIVIGSAVLALDGARALYTTITGKSTYHSYINPELNEEDET